MNTSKQLDITVFRGWKDFGKYVWSPYVIKLEARLRFAGVQYKTEAGSPRIAPKGKIPYIECRNLSSISKSLAEQETSRSGLLLSDSALIAKTLTEWGVLPDLNNALEPSKRLQDLAVIAMLENKLYFLQGFERWIQNYYTMRDHVLWALPYPVRVLVGLLIYRNNVATLHGQGTGRFTPEEIATFRHEIWEVLSAQLSASRSNSSKRGDDEPFWILGGETPSEADTCLFGFIVSAMICTAAPESMKDLKQFPILHEYAERIHNRYFPDYEKWSA
ncbi:putative glutathione S-transferase [Hypomontagnella submonticulosa]|nr:putative glutathione S-transferase [Hypomontagnella submonticulosa]